MPRHRSGTRRYPTSPLTTYGTSLNTYDSQGSAIPTSVYMRKTANDTWQVYTDPTDGRQRHRHRWPRR